MVRYTCTTAKLSQGSRAPNTRPRGCSCSRCSLLKMHFRSVKDAIALPLHRFGNLIAGRIAGGFDPNALDQMPGRFLQMVILPVTVGVLLMVLARPIKRLMAGAR